VKVTFDNKTLTCFRTDPAQFIETVLIDPETKRPYKLFGAQREFLSHAFKTDDEGRLLYPEQVFAAPKKSGKTGLAALHLLVTTLLFGGRYAEGYVVANDLEQAQGRVYEAVRRIVQASPALRSECRITNDRVVVNETGATITALASDYASAAGGHPTISVFDELWGYTSERSRRLWDEMIPVPTRKTSCRLVVTYAGFDGESLLLHELYKRGLQQKQVGPDLYAGDGILMFWSHEPIAPWQDARWLAEMRRSLRPNQFLRMIENRFVGSESAFISMEQWDACVDPNARPVLADPSMSVYVGVDASVKNDSTAIAAVAYDRRSKSVRLINHKIFLPTSEAPIEFEAMVEQTLLDWRNRYRVKAVWYDPYQMAATAQRLSSRLPMREYPQTSGNLTATSQNLYDLVTARNLISYPDEQIRLAISRAIAVESSRGWRIAKDKQSHKIDVVVALSMAALAAVRSEAAPKPRLRTAFTEGDGVGRLTEVDPVTMKPLARELSNSEKNSCTPGRGLDPTASLFNAQNGFLSHPIRRQ
jgi:phage terminase large subunit-like protein